MGEKIICIKKVFQSIWTWQHSPVSVIGGNWNNPQSYRNCLWEHGVGLRWEKSSRVQIFGKKNAVSQHHSSFQNNFEINLQSLSVKKTTEEWITAKTFKILKGQLMLKNFFWENNRPGGLEKKPIDIRYDLRSEHYLLNSVLSKSEN